MDVEKFMKFHTVTHNVEISGFSATQILREINFGHLRHKISHFGPITAINFEFLEIFHISNSEMSKISKFQASKTFKMAVFDLLNTAKRT